MDQYYQPLSHALNPPLVHPSRSPQNPYPPNTYPSATNGTTHREEEEEEEEDEEDIVEEELDHGVGDPNQSPAHHASPRTSAAQPVAATTAAAASTSQPKSMQDQHQQGAGDGDNPEKRKPGRPRGSRNRKPRASAGSVTKAPANSQHPGFYQYPPVPGGTIPQNQQFYEFQWRALNLCSEFYNAAEELVKAASPVVIAQCYQMGPANKIDPLIMISEAKRVCDSLLANPSQLVGQPPPPVYSSMPPYSSMAPPPPPSAPASGAQPQVITNPQSFVMSLGASSMAPPSHPGPHAQPYYAAPMYGAPGSRYPTAPYYSYPSQTPAYPYTTPAQPHTSSAAPAAAAPAPASNTGTISTFNAATGTAAPGGQQGTWSDEETARLRNLAEESKSKGGPQNKGEIEWDWVVQQWGNSRTRHQILLKATSMGLKESTTRGTKRRRENDSVTRESEQPTTPATAAAQPQQTPAAPVGVPTPTQSPPVGAPAPSQQPHSHIQSHPQAQPQSHAQPPAHPHPPIHAQPPVHTQPPAHSQPQPQAAPVSAAPVQAQRTPTTTPSTIPTQRPTTTPSTSASTMPWPMPTVAANTPSPVLANTQTEAQRSTYYRPRPTQTTSYGAAAAQNTPPAATGGQRPPSSHGNTSATHHYMYRPNGAPGGAGDRR